MVALLPVTLLAAVTEAWSTSRRGHRTSAINTVNSDNSCFVKLRISMRCPTCIDAYVHGVFSYIYLSIHLHADDGV